MTQQDTVEDQAPAQATEPAQESQPEPVEAEEVLNQQVQEAPPQYPQAAAPQPPSIVWHPYLQFGLIVAILGTMATVTGQTQDWHIGIIAVTALASVIGMVHSIIGVIKTYGGLKAGLIMLVVGAIFTTLGMSVQSFVPLLGLYGTVPLAVGAITAHVAYMRRILVAVESINAKLGKN